MPPTPPPDGVARSAAELNAAIRALWTAPSGHPAVGLTGEQRAEYRRLLAALEALRAVGRGDVVEAA